MEALVLLLLAVGLYAHSWDLLGVTRSKSTAALAAGVGTALLLAALFSPGGLQGGAANVPTASLAILWAIYALVVAGLGLADQESRSLGLYGLPLTAGSLFLAWKLFSDGQAVRVLLASGAVVAAVPFILLFVYAGLNAARLGRTFGYIQIVASAVIAALAGAAYFAPPP